MYDRYRREDRSAFRYLLCFSESRFSIPAPVRRRRCARFFRKVVAQSYPIQIVIQFSRYSLKGPSLTHTGWGQMHTLNGQNIYGFKNLFTHLDKGCRNAHPFLSFFSKNFIRWKIPSLIWNWKAKTHPIFKKKILEKDKKICPPLLAGIFFISQIVSIPYKSAKIVDYMHISQYN